MRFFMNVRAVVMILTLMFSHAAFSSELDTCIKTVLSRPKLFRLEKEESIKNCVELNKAKIDQNTCFSKVKNLKTWVHSTQLQTQMTMQFENLAQKILSKLLSHYMWALVLLSL